MDYLKMARCNWPRKVVPQRPPGHKRKSLFKQGKPHHSHFSGVGQAHDNASKKNGGTKVR